MKAITAQQAHQILSMPKLPQHKGTFVIPEHDGTFVAIDNTTKAAWTEEFKTLEEAEKWLKREN